MGYMSAKRRAPEFTTMGSWSYIYWRYFAMGVSVLIRQDVMSCPRPKRTTMRNLLG